MCEYKCTYCYAMKEYAEDWMRPGPWKEQQRVIDELGKSTLPVFLGLLGGEPTYHHKYWEMLQQIKDKVLTHKDSRLYITSNGAKSNEFFYKHEDSLEGKLYMLWSYHPEYIEAKERLNFILNVKLMLAKGYKTKVNVMLHPKREYWESTKKVILALNKIQGVEVHPHFIYSDPHTRVMYSPDFYEYFSFIKEFEHKEFSFITAEGETKNYSDIEVFENRYNQFKGWKCWNNNYEINLQCEVNQFCIEDKKPLLKDFFKDITEIKPVSCPHNFCSCDGLLKIKKEK